MFGSLTGQQGSAVPQVGQKFIEKQAEYFGSDLHFFAAIQFTEEIPSAQSTLQPTANGDSRHP